MAQKTWQERVVDLEYQIDSLKRTVRDLDLRIPGQKSKKGEKDRISSRQVRQIVGNMLNKHVEQIQKKSIVERIREADQEARRDN